MSVSFRSVMRTAVFASALALATSPAFAATPGPFGSSETAVAFAIEKGCLTYLREGGRLNDYVGRYARTIEQGGKAVEKIYGNGRVTVREDERGGCYLRVERGDGAQLRDTVINTLSAAGLRTEPFADYEPFLKGRDWAYIQESHCFRMYDIVYITLISSSTTARTPLQVTMFRDREGEAAKKGLCQR